MQEIEKKKSEMRGDVPEGWVIKKLETLAVIQQGISKGKIFKNVETVFYPYLRVANVKDGYFDLSEIKLIQLPVTDLDRYAIEKDDVLITEGGDPDKLGRGSIWNNELERPVFQNHLFRIRSNPKDLIPQFLFNVLQSHRTKTYFLGSAKQTTGIASINSTQVKSTPILLPPISDQRAIADCLSTWDEAIQTAEELIRQKELQKKWLMQQLLTGKKRLKGFSGEWRFIRFKEIYSQVKEKVGARSFLTLSVTKGGIVSQEEYFKKEISSDDTSNYLVVEKGNMVMSGLNFWMGSIDVLTHFDSGKVSPAYKVFEIINDTISPELMKIFVRSQLMLEALIGSSVIGASIVRRNMDRETLDEWSFKIPSLEEQQAIASILSESNRELDLLRKRLAKLQEQKKGLMQVLLTGKRRLNLKK
jgi:type I restriction enzyme S subunit